jgi:DNA-binding GntR family transcriptional regulator
MRDGVLMDRTQIGSSSDGVEGQADPLGVPRNLLRDAVFARMLSSILRGEYRKGQRLRLETLANDMRVSRTPVREALAPLETLRLVTVQRYVGVIIAQWSIEQMVERLRMARSMLLELPAQFADGVVERFDPAWVRACRSDAGIALLLTEWAFRQRGCPVAADWAASQRPMLDMVFTPDIAQLHGVDVAVGLRDRKRLVDRARSRALADDLDGAITATAALLGALATVPGHFRAQDCAS